MTSTSRRNLLIGIVAVCLLVSGGYATYLVVSESDAGSFSKDWVVPANSVVFRNASGASDDDRVSMVRRDNTSIRLTSSLRCVRVYFNGGQGLCLSTNGARTGFVAKLFDAQLDVKHEVRLSGIPSRARISHDGRYGASTVFVQGHSYSDGQFSTETALYDMRAGTRIGQLEEFTTTIDDKRVDAPDVNYWGVTFAADSNVFYATLQTGGKKFLVQGDIAAKTMKKIANDVECPSLSPDQTRVAYKKAISKTIWRVHVLELSTMRDVEIAEPRSIDDQVEWLDDSTLLYGTVEQDIYRVPADGTGSPELWLDDASSPAMVN